MADGSANMRLKEAKKNLGIYYMNKNSMRKIAFINLYECLNMLTHSSIKSVILFIIFTLIEFLQIVLILWSFIDRGCYLEFDSQIGHLSATVKIRKYVLPYITFINLFKEISSTMFTYLIITISHFSFELIFTGLFLLLQIKKIRNSLFGRIISKIVSFRIILSLTFLNIMENSLCCISFDMSKNFKDYSNTKQWKIILIIVINVITLIVKNGNIIIFSLLYNDFNSFKATLPWSSPFNLITVILNIFKLFLIFAVLYIQNASYFIKLSMLSLFISMLIYHRYLCPFYYNSAVTDLRLYLEGVIILFSYIFYGYLIINEHFLSNKTITNIDIIFLFILTLIFSLLYQHIFSYLNRKGLFHFFDDLLSLRHSISMFSMYVRLCQLERYALLSKTNSEMMTSMFEYFSAHFEVCIEENCFCKEMKTLLLNKEVVFKQNKITELLITLNQNDFVKANIKERENNSLINNTNSEIDEAVVKFIDIGHKGILHRSNDKIFWGKFIAKIAMNYLLYNIKTCKGKRKQIFFSLLNVDDIFFHIVKVENANITMFLLDNPMEALCEMNLISYPKSFIISYVIYTSMKSIFNECFTAVSSSNLDNEDNINGVEMKNILLYNKLFNDFIDSLKSTSHNAKCLWLSLHRRLFSLRKIEQLCDLMRSSSSEVTRNFNSIGLINGLTTSSNDIDYKVFKIYALYQKKIWHNEEESEFYVKKAIDEIYNNYQVKNSAKTPKFEENFCQDVVLAMNVFFKLNDSGVAILDGNMATDNFCKVIYANEVLVKKICLFDNLTAIKGKNISNLMPDFIGSCHDGYIKHFFQTSQMKIINCVRNYFLINKNKLFVPIKLLVKFLPTISNGVNFVGYITKSDFNDCVASRSTKIGYILTDINGKVLFFDKNSKNALNLKSSLIYNLTKLPEDDFYIHSLFPELLNVAKLNELKHNNTISLIFNDYAIKKYMKTHSDEAVEEVSSSTSSKFKVGLIDKTLWNFDTKYMNTIKSFNKAFNIFYIVIESEVEEAYAMLDEMKRKEGNEGNDDETENISSMVSSISMSTSNASAASVNVMLSTIKTSLITHSYPMTLRLIGSVIVILISIIIIVGIVDCIYVTNKLRNISKILSFLTEINNEEDIIIDIRYRISILLFSLFNIYKVENENELKNQISDDITKMGEVQNLINKQSDITSLISSLVREQSISYVIYLSETNVVNSTSSLINFEMDHAQNIARILAAIEYEHVIKDKSNFIYEYKGENGFGYERKSLEEKEFIVNMMSYTANFVNFLEFYHSSFRIIVQKGLEDNIDNIKKFLMWITIGICIFFVLFYLIVFIVLYLLTLKIFSIAMLLITIPYHYIVSSYEDVLSFEKMFDEIIHDDLFFINNTMTKPLPDKKPISHDAITTNSDVQSTANLINVKNTIVKENNQNVNSNQNLIKSKNDEETLKYDSVYQKTQKSIIKQTTFHLSLNIELPIIILSYIIVYVISYILASSRSDDAISTMKIIIAVNDVRSNLDMMIMDSQSNVVNNQFNFDMTFTTRIVYNFTLFNRFMQSHRNNNFFSDIKKYYDTITSYDACTVGSVLPNNLCVEGIAFDNGIELGAMRVAAIIRGKNTAFKSMPKNDSIRDIILSDDVINKIKKEIVDVYDTLMKYMTDKVCDLARYEGDIVKYIALIKEGVMIVLSVAAIGIYFCIVQKRYFEHFLNCKILVLMIPMEFLKKNKKHLINYI